MMKLLTTLALTTLTTMGPLLAQDFVTGHISKSGQQFYIESSEGKLRIKASELILKSLPSLHDPKYVTQSNQAPYSFEFKGKKQGDSFVLDQVPTNIPGPASLRGTLKYDSKSKLYSISGVAARFGYTKELSGYRFDDTSKKYFVGKQVLAEGSYDEHGQFIMQALTPLNLFSASAAPKEINPHKLILKDMPLNKNSQKQEAFRRTIYEGQGQGVEKGDHALIVTMSGRQGDSFGSVNGHFVAGLAEVKDDLSLRGEVSNAYVTNGKDILSGNTGLTNYFSHLVQGQNVYRPTYTLIVYGIEEAKLKQFRNALEAAHIQFRTQKLDITAQFNCTTETVKALSDADINGKYVQITNSIAGLVATPLRLFGDNGETIQFALGNDPSRYHPRAAFESFVNAFLDEGVRSDLGVKRIDYVFYPQIPSNRPVGGIALGSIWKVNKYKKLYEKYEVEEETKLSVKDLRVKLEEILPEVENY